MEEKKLRKSLRTRIFIRFQFIRFTWQPRTCVSERKATTLEKNPKIFSSISKVLWSHTTSFNSSPGTFSRVFWHWKLSHICPDELQMLCADGECQLGNNLLSYPLGLCLGLIRSSRKNPCQSFLPIFPRKGGGIIFLFFFFWTRLHDLFPLQPPSSRASSWMRCGC